MMLSAATKSRVLHVFILGAVCQSLSTAAGVLKRRDALAIGITLLSPEVSRATEEAQKYEGNGYSFFYPSEFALASKPVKTHLDEVLVKQGKRQIGVVVDRVKLNRLEDFGDPNFVGDRVVKSELGRDGVTDAQLVSAEKVMKKDGLTYYNLEYTNASSRGDNHFLASVTVRDGRLYILTASARISDYVEAEAILREAVSSFSLT